MNDIYLKKANDKDFFDLIGREVSSIKTDGNNSDITDDGLKYISQLDGLKELDLEWATQITDIGISYLCKLSTLTYIDLSFCKNISTKAIEELRAAIDGITIEY
ncbi:MAG: hypothetical protein COW58_05295 [Thalassolituus sp. CG17_big_fil_post_rev_8_21_14_2_50_53_8]|nr:MAG: hypothetical protein COW58_05295 [Thalassolituus sp. CG17_big_fil_post_rev_8_21_14_2_50_53_8]